ncbi:MAG: hypothetical protein AAGE83_02680 [Pseudomonadota bacterium]
MTDFTAYPHPVLAVPCPDCGKRAGAWCVRPGGHRAADLHRARKTEADRVFIAEHGLDASIERTPEGWVIDPIGCADRAEPAPIEPAQGDLFE